MEVETTKLSTFLVGAVGIVVLPLGFLWATNTLFQLNIDYTFINWLGVLFLQLYFQIIVKAATTPSKTKK
tara:strand:- start:386 stop:595 length:210 start_codon:yes stop_codon:yes gene_type:complete